MIPHPHQLKYPAPNARTEEFAYLLNQMFHRLATTAQVSVMIAVGELVHRRSGRRTMLVVLSGEPAPVSSAAEPALQPGKGKAGMDAKEGNDSDHFNQKNMKRLIAAELERVTYVDRIAWRIAVSDATSSYHSALIRPLFRVSSESSSMSSASDSKRGESGRKPNLPLTAFRSDPGSLSITKSFGARHCVEPKIVEEAVRRESKLIAMSVFYFTNSRTSKSKKALQSLNESYGVSVRPKYAPIRPGPGPDSGSGVPTPWFMIPCEICRANEARLMLYHATNFFPPAATDLTGQRVDGSPGERAEDRGIRAALLATEFPASPPRSPVGRQSPDSASWSSSSQSSGSQFLSPKSASPRGIPEASPSSISSAASPESRSASPMPDLKLPAAPQQPPLRRAPSDSYREMQPVPRPLPLARRSGSS